MGVKPSLEFRREPSGDPATAVFRLSGKMTGTRECYEFLDAAREFIHDQGRLVILDLSGLERMSSPGVGILAAIYTTATCAHAGLALIAVPEPLRKLLKILLLWDLLPHYASLEEALAADRGKPAGNRPPSGDEVSPGCS